MLQGAGQTDKPLCEAVTKEALALLGQATHDWIPGAAKISAALSWEGLKLLSPDGLPLVGNAVHPGSSSTPDMGRRVGGWRVARPGWWLI